MMVRVLKGTRRPQRKKTDLCDGDTTQRRKSSFEHNNVAEKRLCFSRPAPNPAAVNVGLYMLSERTCPGKMRKMPRGGTGSAAESSPFFPLPPSFTLPT